MSLVKDDKNVYFPNDKYMFVRRSIISYFSRCIKNDEHPEFELVEYTKFLGNMYQVYCKYKENSYD